MILNIKDYLVTPAFVIMPKEDGGLGLKGNEATVFSLIYSFSRDGDSWFQGSQAYLAAWCGSTTRGVRKNLDALLEKKLIEKRESKANGRLVCDYRVSPSSSYRNKVPTSAEQSSHHIIEDNITPSNKDSNESLLSPPKGKSSFVKPTIDEIRNYCAEKGYHIDAEQFWHHYESNGWRVGRVPMKSWKSALVTWNKNRTTTEPKKGLREG